MRRRHRRCRGRGDRRRERGRAGWWRLRLGKRLQRDVLELVRRPATTAAASTGASGDDGWECFVQGGGCQCDQLGFDYELEECGDFACCVAYPDTGNGPSCLCGDDQATCDELLELNPAASPSATCPP